MLIVAGIGALAGAARAQEAPVQNGTATPTPAPNEVNMNLSPVLTLTGWEYESGEWRLKVEAKTPTRMTLTDAAAVGKILTEGSGPAAGTARTRTVNVQKGRSVVTFKASEYAGMAAVTVAPQRANKIAVLRTDALAAGSTFIKSQTAGLLIAGAVVVTGYGTYRRVMDKFEDESNEVERHL